MLSSTSLVLVCFLPSQRDLEIARLLGWYRIPLRRAPKVIAVDYVAFYQPASFGERGAQIEYIAALRGHELTTRGELLKDEPDHPRAREEYYKLQIGALEKLPRPIPAEKWRRVTFFYSTGEYLLNAHSLTDLIVRDDERALLWRSLRERAESAPYQTQTDLPQFDIDPLTLAALLGIRELQAPYAPPEKL